ncbi:MULTISPECIES: thioesterase family protein [unclassified Paludibacterium]|uniref:acyl-CoA thioesterase n=1 Tax=unclassified Paludibacterium TaxID=2618429 RepID=UPI001C052BE7|nr:acyl-CoA thioesterase [Paludibacterium sp. B53371]BEV72611.1 hypothetical protein THUN1379_20930 [Paludibacterium sp. THUN1379]
MTVFTKTHEVRWADIDANQHLRHSAYADLCTHTRFEWLNACGFPAGEFVRHGFGPVLFSEQTIYRKEVHLGDRVEINVELAGASEDFSRWKLRQEIRKQDGTLAAIYEVSGAWLRLQDRKLIAPPEALMAILQALPLSGDYQLIPTKTRTEESQA